MKFIVNLILTFFQFKVNNKIKNYSMLILKYYPEIIFRGSIFFIMMPSNYIFKKMTFDCFWGEN